MFPRPFGYLGVLQREVAESKLGCSRFAVYHPLPPSPLLENMKTEIQLACVFKSSRDIFTHFSICEHINNNDFVEYFVDTGTSKPRKTFRTISDLISHYCGR